MTVQLASKILCRAAACLAIGLLLMAPVQAAVIFNNGIPNTTVAGTSWFAETGSAFSEVADDFSLAAGLNVIRDIHWWGVYGTDTAPPTDNFAITIYDDSSGPGTVAASVVISSVVRTVAGGTVNELTLYKYDALVDDITLTAGTNYWLGISNDSGDNGWAWTASNPFSGNLRQYDFDNATWSGSRNDEAAFNLTNELVPEPSSIALAAGAALGIAYLVRRKWKMPTSA